MAEKHVIEVEARFTSSGLDTVVKDAAKADKAIKDLKKSVETVGKGSTSSNAFNGVASSATKAETAIKKTKTAADRLAKTKADVKVGVKDKATTYLNKIKNSLKGFTGSKAYNILLSAKDKASHIIGNVLGLAKTFGNGIYQAGLFVKDHASDIIGSVKSGLQTVVGKTWTAILNVKDNISGTIQGITNKLFSLKTLIAGVMGGMAMNTFALKPIAFSDMMRNSAISFETMLGSVNEGAKMMNNIKQFARTTPLDTTGVIESVRTMLNSGAWNKDNVMTDIEKIGNAAMASGGGVDAMKGITLALSQMSMTGRVNAQDMMQLANRGIPAWQMLADYFQTSVQEVRKMSKDGELSAEEGIAAIMQGLDRYDGMMTKLSRETASGIWSNIKDTFQLSIVEKWGNGLQKGAIGGLTEFAGWLDRIAPKLDKAGASLERIGEYLSKKVFGTLEKGWNRVEDILDSPEFTTADGIGAKMKVLFGTIFKDLGNTFKNWLKEAAPDIGKFLGTMLSKGIIGLSDFLTGAFGGDTSGIDSIAADIGSSFWEAFCNAFDGERVWPAIKRALSSIFTSASKILPGGESPTLSSWVAAALLGKTVSTLGLMPALSGGGKLLGKGATKGLGALGTYLGTSTGTAGLAVGGVVAGSLALSSGVNDYYQAYKAGKSGDAVERNAKIIEGTYKVGGTALGAWGGFTAGAKLGAGLGTAISPGIGTAIGTAIGMGIGALAGWIGGDYFGNKYRNANSEDEKERYFKERQNSIASAMNFRVKDRGTKMKFGSDELMGLWLDPEASSSEFKEAFDSKVAEDMVKRFGKLSLTLEEIDEIAKDITFGNALESFEKFNNAVVASEQSLSQYASSKDLLDRWKLKTSMGMEFKGDSVDEISANVDAFMTNAQSVIDNFQYEFNASAELLLNLETAEGKGILDSGNAFYQEIQEKIKNLNVQIDEKIKLYSEDGVLTLDEQAEIQNLQNQVDEIISGINEARRLEKLETIKLQYTTGNGMTLQNFEELSGSLATYGEEALAALQESRVTLAVPWRAKLEKGEITQTEYKTAIEAINAEFKEKLSNLQLEIATAQIEVVAGNYADVFGGAETAATNIKTAIETALNKNSDPINWTTDQLEINLGLKEGTLADETLAAQLKSLLSMIFQSTPVEADVPVEPNPVVSPIDYSDPMQWGRLRFLEATGLKLPGITATQDVKVNPVLSYSSGFVTGSTAAGFALKHSGISLPATTATQDVSVTYNPTPAQPETYGPYTLNNVATTVNTDNTYNPSPNEPSYGPYSLSTTASVDVYTTYNHINVNSPTPSVSSGTKSSGKKAGKKAAGGFVNGTQLSWLAEEGYPEVVIPFNPARRERALNLWAETGRRLGIINNANGGIVGESSTANKYEPPQTELNISSGHSSSGVSVKMEKGSVQININSDSSQSVSEAIDSQKEEIAEKIAGVISRALGAQFANMPIKVTL